MGSIGLTEWLAAIVNLDHPAHYIHAGWFQISTANPWSSC